MLLLGNAASATPARPRVEVAGPLEPFEPFEPFDPFAPLLVEVPDTAPDAANATEGATAMITGVLQPTASIVRLETRGEPLSEVSPSWSVCSA